MLLAPSTLFRIGCWSFLGGTAVGLFFALSWSMALLVCAVSVSWLSIIFFGKYGGSTKIFLILTLVSLASFLGGWGRAASTTKFWTTLPEASVTMLEARVVNPPREKDRSVEVSVRALRCAGVCPDVLIVVSLPPYSSVISGDRLELSCPLKRPRNFSDDFNYPMYLAKEGIGYECRFPKTWSVIDHESSVFRGIFSLRAWLESGGARAVPDPEAGLLAGLVLGGDGRLPADVQNAFSRTGLSHIVAVSGYNVTLVAAILMGLFVLVGLWRQDAYWAAILGIILFTVLVGAPSSAVRALIMAGLVLSATRFGRAPDPQNALLAAATGMLFVNPLFLRYDIGFELSFLATVGLFVASPLLMVSLRLGDIVATTIAAELFVLPIILFNFHALPVVSLLANVLVLPVVPFAMLFGFIGMSFGSIAPAIATIIGFPGFLLARYILSVVEYLSKQPFASLSVPSFGVWYVVLWYSILLLALFFLKQRGWIGRRQS